MQFFQHKSYISLLREATERRKQDEPSFSFQRLAQLAGIQKSYLSKALNGYAHLNADQLFSLSEIFGWNEAESRFAHLLLEHERSGVEKRRQKLAQEIARIRESKMETSQHIKAPSPELSPEAMQEFYLNPWLQVLHVAISISPWAASVAELGKKLGVEPAPLKAYLARLVNLGLAEWQGKGIRPKQRSLHLPKSSPLFFAWRNQIRMHCLNRLQMAPMAEDYSFSVTYSADEPTRAWLHQEFLSLLGRLEQKVKQAPTESVYQMNFDLFPWARR